MLHPSENDTPSADEAESLADIYSFLALSLRYPERHFLTDEFLSTLKIILEALDWQTEKKEICHWLEKDQDPLTTLQAEYTRLFINAAPHTIAPPYASVYMDGDRNIQGKTTEKIQDYYRECGYDLADDSTEPADHLQHQLEFLANITRSSQYDQEQFFLNRFFRPWFQRFQGAFIEGTAHPFYRVSVQLIDFITKEEQ